MASQCYISVTDIVVTGERTNKRILVNYLLLSHITLSSTYFYLLNIADNLSLSLSLTLVMTLDVRKILAMFS